MPGERIFISYRRQDSAAYAGRIGDRLVRRYGKPNIFVDVDRILPGQDFREVINASVAAADILLVMIGPSWLQVTERDGTRRLDNPEDFVRLEILAAIEKRKVIIPVLLGNVKMPTVEALPEKLQQLAHKQAIEISDTRFHSDVDRLIESIDAIGTASRGKSGLL